MYHFCFDFSHVSPLILGSKESMRLLLSGIVDLLKMTPVGEPVIEQMIDCDRPTTHCGITAVQIIKESLIDVHTYTENGSIYISVFSCREYNQLIVYEWLCTFLDSRSGFMVGVKRQTRSERIKDWIDKYRESKIKHGNVGPYYPLGGT